MDLRDTPAGAAFRNEIRAWLEATLPRELRDRRHAGARWGDARRDWSRRLAEAGYAALTWPEEYGGGGAAYELQAILLEELARAEAPAHINVIGLGMAGPAIIAHGTHEQKARYLPKILSAEEIWCQGFSEPDAGSDLAAVRTSARLDGDHFVVEGQKIWSSFAHIADRCILLARSDPESQRHSGLTYLLVDMHAPGIEVRPLRQLTGEAEFNEIFFSGARVPVENVLGEIGGGWAVAMTTLQHERATLGYALLVALEVNMRRLIALARERANGDALLRDRVAEEWIELQALRLTNSRLLGVAATRPLGPETSVAKLRWAESNQRLTKLALELLGDDAELCSVDGGEWQYQQLRSRGNTIEAGTSEVLRNIIAERVLGLPRSR
jgi:alkylation response protein AidB-like acyl-CoA dehydrogenase